jgi:hypothetical protein
MKWEPKGRFTFANFSIVFKYMTNVKKTWIKTFKVVHLKDWDLGIKYIISILDFMFDMILILSMYDRDFLIVVTNILKCQSWVL